MTGVVATGSDFWSTAVTGGKLTFAFETEFSFAVLCTPTATGVAFDTETSLGKSGFAIGWLLNGAIYARFGNDANQYVTTNLAVNTPGADQLPFDGNPIWLFGVVKANLNTGIAAWGQLQCWSAELGAAARYNGGSAISTSFTGPCTMAGVKVGGSYFNTTTQMPGAFTQAFIVSGALTPAQMDQIASGKDVVTDLGLTALGKWTGFGASGTVTDSSSNALNLTTSGAPTAGTDPVQPATAVSVRTPWGFAQQRGTPIQLKGTFSGTAPTGINARLVRPTTTWVTSASTAAGAGGTFAVLTLPQTGGIEIGDPIFQGIGAAGYYWATGATVTSKTDTSITISTNAAHLIANGYVFTVGGQALTSYAAVTGFAVSGIAWSGALASIPAAQIGPWAVQVQEANATGITAISPNCCAMGVRLPISGQSNVIGLTIPITGQTCTVPASYYGRVSAATLLPGTPMATTNSYLYAVISQEIQSKLPGLAVEFVHTAIGGTSMIPIGTAGTWTGTEAGGLVDVTIRSILGWGGGAADSRYFHQGENETKQTAALSPLTAWSDGLVVMNAAILAGIGATDASCPLYNGIIGPQTIIGSGSDASSGSVRLDNVRAGAKSPISRALFQDTDIALDNQSAHPFTQIAITRRIGVAVMARLGVPGYDSASGPVLRRVTVNGAVVRLDFTPCNPSGIGLKATDNLSANPRPIDNIQISDSARLIPHAGPPVLVGMTAYITLSRPRVSPITVNIGLMQAVVPLVQLASNPFSVTGSVCTLVWASHGINVGNTFTVDGSLVTGTNYGGTGLTYSYFSNLHTVASVVDANTLTFNLINQTTGVVTAATTNVANFGGTVVGASYIVARRMNLLTDTTNLLGDTGIPPVPTAMNEFVPQKRRRTFLFP